MLSWNKALLSIKTSYMPRNVQSEYTISLWHWVQHTNILRQKFGNFDRWDGIGVTPQQEARQVQLCKGGKPSRLEPGSEFVLYFCADAAYVLINYFVFLYLGKSRIPI